MPTSFAGDLSTAFLTNATLTLTRNCVCGQQCHPHRTPRCADGALREPLQKQSGAASSAWQCALSATGDESLRVKTSTTGARDRACNAALFKLQFKRFSFSYVRSSPNFPWDTGKPARAGLPVCMWTPYLHSLGFG